MSAALRIIDANANRAREALRVMEEAARFILDDAKLTEELKLLRHDLTTGLLRFDDLEFWRDARADVGAAISTPGELRRETVADVAAAAGKRLGEALRALEEYGKTLDVPFACYVEQLRYRGYELERRLNARFMVNPAPQWVVCAIITESLCAGRPWLEVADAAIEAGADCIQLREKALGDRELLSRAATLVRAAGDRAAVVVNDRPDIALCAGARGVHLGQSDMQVRDARKIVGRDLLIGVSTSCLAEARRALEDGANYCGVGPMFPSSTKEKERIAGPSYLAEFVRWRGLPHLAIGGIGPHNVHELAAAGCKGVAVSSNVCAAANPADVVRHLRAALDPKIQTAHATARPSIPGAR